MPNLITQDVSTEIVLTASSGQTSFSFSFAIFEAGDLRVLVNGVQQAPVAISGIGEKNGGTVTLDPVAGGARVILQRIVPVKRSVDLPSTGPYSSDDIDKEFDRAFAVLQEHKSFDKRSLAVPVGEAGPVLPAAAARINSVLAFDSKGLLAVTPKADFVGPVGPAGSAISVAGLPIISAQEFGADPSGLTDSTDAIMSALASTSSPIVHFGPGTYLIRRGVLEIPSGRALVGAGIDKTILKIIPLAADDPNQSSTLNAISTAAGCVGVGVMDLTLDCSKSGLGRGGGNRCHGLVHYGKGRAYFVRARFKDVYGYGAWCNGSTTNRASAHFIDCYTENCEVHFEQTHAHDVLIERAIGSAGDGDIPCESFFHQYGDADRITMKDSYFKGAAGGGAWNPLAEFAQLGRVALINSHLEVTGATLGLSFGGTLVAGAELYIEGSLIKSAGNNAANITGGKLIAVGSKFHGAPIGMAVGGSAKVYATNCEGLGTTTDATQGTYGVFVDPGGYAAWTGGRIASSGGVNFTYGGAPKISDQTELVPAVTVTRNETYVQKAAAADDGVLSGGFPKSAGLAVSGASDAVGNAAAIEIKGGDTGGQVYLRSINQASGHSSFEVLIRNASNMVRGLEIASDLSVNLPGSSFKLAGTQVLTTRQAAIANHASDATVNAILSAMRAHGLIAP